MYSTQAASEARREIARNAPPSVVFYETAVQKKLKIHLILPPPAKVFRRFTCLPFEGEHETVGTGKTDFFRDFSNAQIGRTQQLHPPVQPPHQLIVADGNIHLFFEMLSERTSGNMKFF